MMALADACAEADYPAQIVGVLSDKADAPGLVSARAQGIATVALERSNYESKTDHEAAIVHQLEVWDTQIVCLAGFMRILSADFVTRWAGRIINIHPSLLPRHKGLDPNARALAAGDTEHGCTVHHVTAGIDEGPSIARSVVPILPGDTEQTLAARVLAAEHVLYPRALRLLIDDL